MLTLQRIHLSSFEAVFKYFRVCYNYQLNLVEKKKKEIMNVKHRDNPVITKLDTPEFRSVLSAEVMDLKALFDKYQYELRIAGGAVRDLLMTIKPHDLDFATTATPTQMKDMFTAENIRMINETGEKHGTITARINDKDNFEVTTLRVDVVTDGRRAEVLYTTDWLLDANRRDLTINSMYLGFDGTVYDYFYGYEDVINRRVAFVGNPEKRIQEDYLRIMRYFRFYGRIAEKPDAHEEATLQAIKNNVEGLQIISGERIWMELKKILQGNFSAELMKTMLNVGIGKYIGLPSEPDVDEFDSMVKRGHHLQLHPMCYLAALLRKDIDVNILNYRLKFSAYERDLIYFLLAYRDSEYKNSLKRPLWFLEKLVLTSNNQKIIIEYAKELLKYKGEELLLKEFSEWNIPHFPIGGRILNENGVPPGKMIGFILRRLKEIWIDSDYQKSVDDMVKLIPEMINECNDHKLKKKNVKKV